MEKMIEKTIDSKILNIYFDTEFTGLHQNTTLISLGLVTDYDESFYAEFTDYDTTQVNPWIQENVIDKCYKLISFSTPQWTYVHDSKSVIQTELLAWLQKMMQSHECTSIQFVSDVCHYDFVLLVDLIAGDALNMPQYISPVCIELNQYISKYFNISDQEAFNMSRENILVNNPELLEDINEDMSKYKHMSIWDAVIIGHIYRKICH